jgi:methanogenic corrinoid protein MtbC1
VVATEKLKFIEAESPLAGLAQQYLEARVARQRYQAAELVEQALETGVSLKQLYLEVFQPVQYEIGWLWQRGEISVGHEHYCTNASQLIMSSLYARLFRRPAGERKLVAACVQGELHEFGLRMLADFFEMEGWDTLYLGANTPGESVISALEETGAELLAIGATMHDQVASAADLIAQVRGAPHVARIPILVGGYTFRTVEGLWQKTGADGSARDAQQAVALGTELVTRGGTHG